MNNEDRQSGFMARSYYYQMRTLFVAFIVLAAFTASADDLEALKTAARHYVVAMKAVLALPEGVDCSETIGKADEYAAAKIAYYDAARQAMPVLLQNAKGQDADRTYGEELIDIFQDFGEDKDEEATATLEAKLHQCMSSYRREEALRVVEHARQTAVQFVKDFGRLEGV
jgi:hypothetical protein